MCVKFRRGLVVALVVYCALFCSCSILYKKIYSTFKKTTQVLFDVEVGPGLFGDTIVLGTSRKGVRFRVRKGLGFRV